MSRAQRMPVGVAPRTASKADPRTAQTLDRGLQILEVLSDSGRPMTVAELAETLGVHRTIVHRLAVTLEARAFVSRGSGSRVSLGPKILTLAAAVGSDLRQIARPHLEELRRRTGETVNLAVLAGTDVVIIESLESDRVLRVGSREGRALPAHCTSLGKAILATLPAETLRELYPRRRLRSSTTRSITDRTQLETELRRVREQGFAVNEGESEDDLAAVGAAVVDRSGQARAAISVAAPLARFDADALRTVSGLLVKTAAAIGASLRQGLPD